MRQSRRRILSHASPSASSTTSLSRRTRPLRWHCRAEPRRQAAPPRRSAPWHFDIRWAARHVTSAAGNSAAETAAAAAAAAPRHLVSTMEIPPSSTVPFHPTIIPSRPAKRARAAALLTLIRRRRLQIVEAARVDDVAHHEAPDRLVLHGQCAVTKRMDRVSNARPPRPASQALASAVLRPKYTRKVRPK